MAHLSENPLAYRWQLQQKRRPFWLRHLSSAVHLVLLCAFAYSVDGRNYCDEGPWVFLTLVWTLYLCGRPLLEGVQSLAVERQRGTYEALLTTGLGARDWVHTSFWMLVRPRWIELTLTVTLGCFFGQAADWLRAGAFLAAAIPAYAAAGLYLSSRHRQPVRAQLQALTLLIGAFFISVAVDALLVRGGEPSFCHRVSPWFGTYALLCGRFNFAAHTAGLSAAVLAYAGLSTLMLRAAQGALLRPQTRSVSKKRAARRLDAVHHPLLYRLLSQRSPSWSLLAIPLFLLALDYSHHSEFLRSGRDTNMLGLVLVAIYTSVRVAMAGSQALAGERENRNWESLLATRLRLPDIYFSQAALCLLPVLVETLLLGGLWVLLAEQGPTAALYLTLWTCSLGCFALYQSCRSSSSARALGITAATALFLSFAGFFSYLWSRDSGLAAISPFYVLARLGESHHLGIDLPISIVLYSLAAPLCLLAGYRCLRNS